MPSEATTSAQRTGHRIFVLTFWLEEPDELGNSDAWRFRLEEPRSGTRRGCVGIQDVVALLSSEIGGEELTTNKEKRK